MTEKELKDMKLHDELFINDWGILRVPKRWIYTLAQDGEPRSSQFVPEIIVIQEHVEPRLR